MSDKSISDSKENEVHIHGSQQSTIAGALFHELVEALMDPTVNSWWQNGSALNVNHADGSVTQSGTTFSNGTTFCCAEVADPTQQNFVVIKCGSEDIAFSDFIFPAWKILQNTAGPFNYINTLKTPFTVDVGGYVVILGSDGSSQQVFSKAMAGWLKT